jgi:serine/threonine protein kinase
MGAGGQPDERRRKRCPKKGGCFRAPKDLFAYLSELTHAPKEAPLSTAANKRIGTKIGPYTVVSHIGGGGMASVFSVTDANGGWAALKILHRPLSIDEVAVARFFEEAYLVNSVKHPGVCRIVDDGVSEDRCPYLVMELLEGENLDERLEAQGTLPLGETIALGIDVADTLTSVHEAGIVHRDLKPPNLFVTFSGAVKLLDFGVGKSRATALKTMEGVLLGTPGFMSPEQAIGTGKNKMDGRTDIFSLGAVLFRAITGENVHNAKDSQARWFAAATQQARSLGEVVPNLPEEVVTAVDRALVFDREGRWPTASAFRQALERARRSLDDGMAKSRNPPPQGSFIAMLHELHDGDDK